MRKSSFLIGLLCGSLLFGGLTVFANAEIVAKITSQVFFWNNRQIELEAYNINGATIMVFVKIWNKARQNFYVSWQGGCTVCVITKR